MLENIRAQEITMKSCRAGAWGGPQGAQSFPFASYWVMWSQYVHTLCHNIVFLSPFLFFCYEGCVSREKRSGGCVTEKIVSNCASAFTAVEMPLWLGNHQGDLQPPLSAFSLRFKRRTEKHHSPGECSLVTASEIPKLWQTDVVAVHGYVSGYSSATAFSSSHGHEAMMKMSPKLVFSSYVAVPVQTDHRNSGNQLSKSLPLFYYSVGHCSVKIKFSLYVPPEWQHGLQNGRQGILHS